MNAVDNLKITPNVKQSLCINSHEGKFLVLAGPGTGKTFTIIERIKSLLNSNVCAGKILCLTFSDTAASEMKARLVNKLGIAASGVNVFTYHAFCNDLISKNPMQFALSSNYKLINDTQKLELMKRVIDKASLVDFVPPNAQKYLFAQDFIEIAQKIKSLRMDYETYISYLDKNPLYNSEIKRLEDEIKERVAVGITKNKTRQDQVDKIKKDVARAHEVWKITELYKGEMQNAGLIDFSDMINFVLDAFSSDFAFLSDVSNQFDYILVDEYQDTNEAQNEIIFNLVNGSKKKNIFVVGDDDQTIFTFQGAKDDNIEHFLQVFPDTKVICLNENNRSTQEILDFSSLIMAQNTIRIENNEKFKKFDISKKLVAKNDEVIRRRNKVKLWQFSEKAFEFNTIIDEIEKIKKTDGMGEKLSEIAILSRKHDEISIFCELLKARNIPFQISGGENIFSIKSVILTFFYLKLLVNPHFYEDKFPSILLSLPFAINPNDFNRLLELNFVSKNVRKNFIENMRAITDFKDASRIKNFLETYDYLKDFASTNTICASVKEVINRTGILDFFMAQEKNRVSNLEGIIAILNEASNFEELYPASFLSDFISYLNLTIENEIALLTSKNTEIQNAVQILTYHGAKGREFEYVFLPNLTAAMWEDSRGRRNKYKYITDLPRSEEQTDADLLKLLFVGATRAKHTLYLSYSDFENTKTFSCTKFLSNIDFDFEYQHFNCEKDDKKAQFVRAISNEVFENQKEFKNLIKAQVERLSLSPSRLNDYQSCKRRFFYTKILMIDVEEASWDSANFGSAIHSVLEYGARMKLAHGTYPTLCEISDKLQSKLDFSRFSNDAIREKYNRDAKRIIEAYYPTFCANERLFDVEFVFDGELCEGKKISGKIDRIDKNEDGTYSLIDYKTGNPQSEKQVSADGNAKEYFNQLCFYKYAYEKMTGNVVCDVRLLYVKEPNKMIVRELCDSDMQHIENLILKTYSGIENFDFAPADDEKKAYCEFCPYRQMCKLDIL